MQKLSKKRVSRELTADLLIMSMVYSTYNLRNINQQKTCLEYKVVMDELWFNHYRYPKKDKVIEQRRRRGKVKFVDSNQVIEYVWM